MKEPEFEPGETIGTSDWLRISQEDIDLFAKATHDPDPMHVDSDWVEKNSPFGKTIAFGFQTTALLSVLSKNVFEKRGQTLGKLGYALNYGLSNMRLPEPVLSGQRVRGVFRWIGIKPKENGYDLITIKATIEIEGNEKPALVANWLFVAPDQS